VTGQIRRRTWTQKGYISRLREVYSRATARISTWKHYRRKLWRGTSTRRRRNKPERTTVSSICAKTL